MSGASSVEELEKMISRCGFSEIQIVTQPVSPEYERKWGVELTVGEYILSINSRVMKRPLVVEEERINFDEEGHEKSDEV